MDEPCVILSGDDEKLLSSIDRALKKTSVSCKKRNRIDAKEEGIYIFDYVPATQGLLDKLLMLSQNGSAIISLYRNSDTDKKRYNFILYLEASTKPAIIARIVEWLLFREKNSLRYRNVFDQLEARKREMVRELALASELQKSIIPKKFPTNIPFSFAWKYVPHEYIGGDFFDVFKLGEEKLGIMIADASGHGVAASFIIAMFKSLLNHYRESEQSPAALLGKINSELFTMIQDHFVTAFYIVIDIKSLECIYCNAGHPKQFHIDRNGVINELNPNSFLMGMFDQVEFEERSFSIDPGDKFFFYTDGIVEVCDTDGAPFGYDRLISTIDKEKNEDIKDIAGNVLSQLIIFMKDNVFPDDITILVAEALEDLSEA